MKLLDPRASEASGVSPDSATMALVMYNRLAFPMSTRTGCDGGTYSVRGVPEPDFASRDMTFFTENSPTVLLTYCSTSIKATPLGGGLG